MFENRLELEASQEKVQTLRKALSTKIKGQEQLIEQLLIALMARGHVLLEVVPGVAKTLAARSMASGINANFSRIQFTPDLMPSDIIGTSIFLPNEARFEIRKGPVHHQIVLIDEINRAPAKTQAALFEVMEEQQCTIDGQTLPMPNPFMVLATQNPIEHEGTYRLPEAQLDRFLFKILVPYPSEQAELEILKMHHNQSDIENTEAILSIQEVITLQETTRSIRCEEPVLSYISDLCRTSRNFNGIALGASPRAGIAILNAAKANALLQNRDFVTPDDVQEMAYPALRHRMLLLAEKEMEGAQTDDLIKLLIQRTNVPK